MKRLLLLAAFAASLFGQGTTCSQFGTFTTATNSTALDNRLPVTRTAACDAWRLVYYSTGLSALSIAVQGAPDSNGAAGTWVDVPSAAVTQGSNPSTTLQGEVLLRTYYPWMRVNVGTFTTTGTIYYILYGVNSNSLAPPVSATISGTADSNVKQWNGNTVDTNSGNKSAGTARVVLATDQPALANKLLVTPDLPSGASTAAKQPALGTAGTPSADVLTVQGVASGTPLFVDITRLGGTTITYDPCFGRAKTIVPFSMTASTRIVTGTASNKTYICSFVIVEGAATNTALVEGTGSTCGSSTVGLAGGATAATGFNFAANGGIAMGIGIGTMAVTTVNANDVCLLLSAANQTSGVIGYVTAP